MSRLTNRQLAARLRGIGASQELALMAFAEDGSCTEYLIDAAARLEVLGNSPVEAFEAVVNTDRRLMSPREQLWLAFQAGATSALELDPSKLSSAELWSLADRMGAELVKRGELRKSR